jgi:hypothetical protein
MAGAIPDGFVLKEALSGKKEQKQPQINMAQYSSKNNQAKNFGIVEPGID